MCCRYSLRVHTCYNIGTFLLPVIAGFVHILLCAHYFNMPSAKTQRLWDKQRYACAKESICQARKEYYAKHLDKCIASSKIAYACDPEKKGLQSSLFSKC